MTPDQDHWRSENETGYAAVRMSIIGSAGTTPSGSVPGRNISRLLSPGKDHLPYFNPANLRYVSGIRDTSLKWIGNIVARELRHQTSSASLLVETLGIGVAERLIANYGEGVRVPPESINATGALDPLRLRRVLAYIEANLESQLSVQALAAVACLSPFHFARAFRQATGGPPHRYVSGRRLALAKQLLRETDRPLADIAATCCFSSAANLSRAFSRVVGDTPGSFRATTRS